MMKVDTTAIKFNQALIVALVVLAYLFDLPVLVLAVAVILAVAVWMPKASLFSLIYRQVFVAAGILKPRLIDDDPRPHRFAQGVGASFLAVGSFLLLTQLSTPVGWVLALMVGVLASINLLFGFCAGCFTYLQLTRLGLIHRQDAGR